jgi:hypothetical protein
MERKTIREIHAAKAEVRLDGRLPRNVWRKQRGTWFRRPKRSIKRARGGSRSRMRGKSSAIIRSERVAVRCRMNGDNPRT